MFFICDVVLTEKFEGLGRASMSVHDNKRKTLAFMAGGIHKGRPK